mmetsp:Transcript_5502/g.8709  ORF Transcript_5502/g.8709 Transcript_5502/m.8709 type:complete len:210 (-) Transcript_5502:227-856(-)
MYYYFFFKIDLVPTWLLVSTIIPLLFLLRGPAASSPGVFARRRPARRRRRRQDRRAAAAAAGAARGGGRHAARAGRRGPQRRGRLQPQAATGNQSIRALASRGQHDRDVCSGLPVRPDPDGHPGLGPRHPRLLRLRAVVTVLLLRAAVRLADPAHRGLLRPAVHRGGAPCLPGTHRNDDGCPGWSFWFHSRHLLVGAWGYKLLRPLQVA